MVGGRQQLDETGQPCGCSSFTSPEDPLAGDRDDDCE